MTTITPPLTHPSQRAHSTSLSFGGVLRSEWIKLRSLRSTTWSYLDHVLVPPGATTPDLAHETVGEAYYVLGGEGTINLAAESAAVRAGDAIAIRIGETSRFTNSGSAPLELLVMGVAKDMATKTQLLTSAPR